MLTLQDISLFFGERQIFDKLSLSLKDGEKAALVGPNGAGKTTLLRLIVGEIQPQSGLIIKPVGARISYVPQYLKLGNEDEELEVISFVAEGRKLPTIETKLKQIDSALQKKLSSDQLEGLLNKQHQLFEGFHGAEGYKAEDDILNLVIGVGLDVDLNHKVRTLSGGQKTKLALARLLYEQSDILLLDEPTNHIEDEAVDWLTNYLKRSQKTVLVVSHLPAFLDALVDNIIFLNPQTMTARTYPGNYSHFLRIRAEEDLNIRRERAQKDDEIARQKELVGRTIQRQAGLKHSREKVIEKLEAKVKPLGQQRIMKLVFPVDHRLRVSVLTVNEISKSFGQRKLFSRLSFVVNPKDRFGVIGQNGTGKTTFLRILAGELTPNEGFVKRNPHLKIGWYRQEQEGLSDDLTVWQEVESFNYSVPYVRSVLAHFLFPSDRINQLVETLSRGERARLALCKIVLQRPNLLLLDEPTNHLDISAKESLKQALANYEGTIVLVSHDIDFMTSIGINWALTFPKGKLSPIRKIKEAKK